MKSNQNYIQSSFSSLCLKNEYFGSAFSNLIANFCDHIRPIYENLSYYETENKPELQIRNRNDSKKGSETRNLGKWGQHIGTET